MHALPEAMPAEVAKGEWYRPRSGGAPVREARLGGCCSDVPLPLMIPSKEASAWRRFLWRLSPPSKIVLRSRYGPFGMFRLSGYTVEDWARDHKPEYSRVFLL